MSDPFWARRTEDAGGLVRADSVLPSVTAWRRLRLTQELTVRHYRRIGLVPEPVTTGSFDTDLDDVALVSADCASRSRYLGRLNSTIRGDGVSPRHPYPDGYGWIEWTDAVEQRLGLPDETHHSSCLHTRADAAFPLMWQVGLLLRTAGADPAGMVRALSTAAFDEVIEHVGGLTAAASDRERAGRWVLLRTRNVWCGFSPTGRSYVGGRVIDLAARHRMGDGLGQLAAAVEDSLAWEDLTPDARRWQHLMRLCSHAGLPTARMLPGLEVADELMFFASDDELTVVADLDASPSVADSALAYGLGLAHDQDLNLVLPAGREQRTLERAAALQVGVRVWVHDGYRVAPLAVPAFDELLARRRAESWSLVPADDDSWIFPEAAVLAAAGRDPGTVVPIRRFTRTGPELVLLGAEAMPAVNYVITDPNPGAVLDRLDQMVWVRAVLDELAVHVGELGGLLRHRILLAAPYGEAHLHPLHPAQVEAIDAGMLTFQQVNGYATDEPQVIRTASQPVCSVPTAGPRPAPPRTSVQRRQHLEEHDPQDFVRSLFAPVGTDGAARVCKALTMPVNRADDPVFGWADEDNLLGEGPDRTSVDVLLTGTTADGRRVAALILVRLLEEELGSCPAYANPANPRRDTCRTNAPFGGDPDACFLLRSPDARPEYRRFVTIAPSRTLEASGWWSADGGCPLRRTNEPLRVLALAEALHTYRRYDQVAVALVAPAFEETIQRRWAEARSMLHSSTGPAMSFLPVEVVLTITDHPTADLIRERYSIGTARLSTEAR
ncbi:hypothetical protein [Actinoplanes sp. NPDC026670]|uniref:hypothetical protein n=1 Tax=Actinoplanes sp. NPDC026670 TaxID=3154700 RepID=UPI00340CD70C